MREDGSLAVIDGSHRVHAMREKGEVTGIKTLKGIIDVGLRVEKF